MPDPTSSAVLVLVPPAEEIVGHLRRALDRSSGWGVPAHVTVLYPFVEPSTIDERLLARLRAVVGSVPRFGCTFARCGWFGDEVLYLAPEPDEPFRRLTAAVVAAFPDHPPYAGEHDDVVPHLTIGHAPIALPEQLRAAQAEVTPLLPLIARIDEAVLVAGTEAPDSWRTVARLPLEAHDARVRAG